MHLDFRGPRRMGWFFPPRQYGGFGIEDLHIEMLAQQTKYFIQHVRNKDSLGKRIRIIMSVYQLETGLDKPVVKRIQETERYLTDSLTLSLLRELSKARSCLQVPHWIPTGGKPTIMGTLIKFGALTEQLEVANRCRLWLKIQHLCDLGTIDGKKVHPGYK